MISYIDAVCEGKPMDLPNYNEDIEQWEIYFEESATPWYPNDQRDVISYACESADEACEVYNYYNQHPAGEGEDNEEDR